MGLRRGGLMKGTREEGGVEGGEEGGSTAGGSRVN